jgi:hypothetical protein
MPSASFDSELIEHRPALSDFPWSQENVQGGVAFAVQGQLAVASHIAKSNHFLLRKAEMRSSQQLALLLSIAIGKPPANPLSTELMTVASLGRGCQI